MNKQTEIIMSQLQNLISNGQIIQAIKLIRTVKKISLKDAKKFVEEFKLQIDEAGNERETLRNQGIEPPRYASEKRAIDHSKYTHDFGHNHRHKVEKELPTAAYLHLQRGEKIQAIKCIREAKGLTLQQAKTMVDRFYSENPQYKISEENKKKSVIPFVILAGIAYFFIKQNFS